MPATREQLFALLQALEQLPPPTRDLDATRARVLGIGRGAEEVFAHCVELLMALAEQPKVNFDAAKSVMQVLADVTQDPDKGLGLGAALFGKPKAVLGPAPPPPPQKPAPGSIKPVTAPPIVTKRGAKSMPRVLSYGGGLDSFAILVRSIEINDKPDVAIFMDVAGGTEKKDSPIPGEWPGTYKHIREVVIPMCKKAGIEFIWLGPQIPVRDERSLFEWMDVRGQIPVSGPDRICTIIAKVERFEKWMSSRYGTQPVEVWIGFEAGEEDRINKDPNVGKSV